MKKLLYTTKVIIALLLATSYITIVRAQEITVAPTTIATSSMSISGPIYVCPHTEATYTLQNAPSGNIVWSVSEGFTLLSGQGTKTVTVQSNGTPNYSTLTVAVVSSPNTYSRTLKVRTNTPYVETVTGPSSVMGLEATFEASPIFSSDICDYEWVVGASGYTINDVNRHIASITFSQPGTYNVGCRTKNNPCTASQAPIFVTVQVGSRYSATYVPSTQSININSSIESTTDKSSVNCELYNLQNGVLVLGKNIQPNGGSIDVTSIPKGNYVLKITNQKNVESFKIQIQ